MVVIGDKTNTHILHTIKHFVIQSLHQISTSAKTGHQCAARIKSVVIRQGRTRVETC